MWGHEASRNVYTDRMASEQMHNAYLACLLPAAVVLYLVTCVPFLETWKPRQAGQMVGEIKQLHG